MLYVGKAKSLRPRVRSYFQQATDGPPDDPQPRRSASHDIEVIVTGSEVEALHLEQNLVKRHRPPFNVRLRDDKSFPYIAVTVEDEYPRVMFTRERHRRGRLVLRPVREREEGARDARRPQPRLPLPAVRGAEAGPALRHPVPRLPHRPLPGAVRRLRLEGGLPRRSSTASIEFLSGDAKPIQRELERQMHEAAADERFEDAARYRNRLFAVQHLAERQAATGVRSGRST